MSDVLLGGTFQGIVRFRTWQDLYLEPISPFLGTTRPDYTRTPTDWEMVPSSRGGYWIRVDFAPGMTSNAKWYWQCDMDSSNKQVVLHSGGADDWETFIVEKHPSGSGYALRSYSNGMHYVCAEPESHSIHLVANRSSAQEWEKFVIDIIDNRIPAPPPAPERKKLPFVCNSCGKQIALCNGNVVGGTCLYCSSPLGNCACPNCGQKYYEIKHTHTY